MAPLRVAGRIVIGIGDSHVQMRDDEDVTVVLLGVLFFSFWAFLCSQCLCFLLFYVVCCA